MTRPFIRLFLSSSSVFALAFSQLTAAGQPSSTLAMSWNASGPDRALSAWGSAELERLKSTSIREKDGASGKTADFQGPLLSAVIEKTLSSVSPVERAQVDLVILTSSSGAKAQIPRWLITRYPLVISTHGKALRVALPTASKPKISDEGLPLQSYILPDVAHIELSSYNHYYSAYYLKRRMDPLAMKGEKIFVQNCTSCHRNGPVESKARRLASGGHPSIPNLPKLNERDMRALSSYFEAYKQENSPTSTASGPSSTTAQK